jgi:histidyl-tRNA synthetase
MSNQQLAGLMSFLENQVLWKKSDSLTRVFSALEALGVRDYVRYDPNTIRGLPYYTSVVFEAYALEGEIKRALLGGGRYDNLMAQVGGDPLPATGFAMGDLAIGLLLQSLDLVPEEITKNPAEVFVTVFDAERQPASMAFSAQLRQAGIKVICNPEVAKLPRQFKYADRIGVRFAIVIGPDEAVTGQISIKDLSNGTQQTIPVGEAVSQILKLLESSHPL